MEHFYGSHAADLEDPRKKLRRNLTRLSVVFAGAGVALAILQVNVLALIALFLDLLLLASCLATLILSWTTLFSVSITRKRNNDSYADMIYQPSSRVDSISTYIRYAAKGSDFSRREIARTINRVLIQRFGAIPPRSVSDSLILGRELSEDLERLIFPYISGRESDSTTSRSQESGNTGEDRRAPLAREYLDYHDEMPSSEREAYLSGVDRIISKLERRR